MPKKRVYSTQEKKMTRRLLLLHNGDIATVQQLTGFPERTIRHWRNRWNDDYQLFTSALARNAPLPAMANSVPKQRAIPRLASAEPVAESADALAENPLLPAMANSVPKQQAILESASDAPFADPADPLAEFAQLRQKLMEHTNTLANDLLSGDGRVHQRVQALSRLLDRILTLDEMLPYQQPQPAEPIVEIKRAEFVYDGAIHEHPPWKDIDAEEGFNRYAEGFLKNAREGWERQLKLKRDPSTYMSEIMGEDFVPLKPGDPDYPMDLVEGLIQLKPESPQADLNQQIEDDLS